MLALLILCLFICGLVATNIIVLRRYRGYNIGDRVMVTRAKMDIQTGAVTQRDDKGIMLDRDRVALGTGEIVSRRDNEGLVMRRDIESLDALEVQFLADGHSCEWRNHFDEFAHVVIRLADQLEDLQQKAIAQ